VVLIVDDDVAVHQVTQLVMSGFEFAGRRLEFLNAYSGIEARSLLASRSDIAIILLDVVMESERAGLELVRYIRGDLDNRHVRIVLRTGQPGQAPEEDVIKTYDINDYKEKTELTKRKLLTVFYSALRSYRDIMIIEQSRQSLRRSIDAITRVYDSHNLRHFASAVLEQVAHLLGYETQGLCASRLQAYAASSSHGQLKVLAATSEYARLLVDEQISELPEDVRLALEQALQSRQSHFAEDHCVAYYRSSAGSESVLYMAFSEPLDAEARELLQIFSVNVSLTYESLLLREEIEETQRSIVHIVGEAVERRAEENGTHVEHVAELAALLGAATGMLPSEVQFLRQAALLHDIGKLGIPDRILNKPGKLDAQEWELVQSHARLGYELLSRSPRRILQLGAEIAHEHHERWDGQGYPRGLAGTEIGLPGRIVAIADVLDTLLGRRCYKEPWAMEEALDFIRDQAGQRFDPELVALLMARLDAVRAIYTRLPAQ
jgi:response regulator RpfG family c-di-GMP phosphodiesterase